MLKIVGIVVVVLLVAVVAVLAYAATRPDTFRVQRQASIKAPPDKIYPLISDFQNWTAWSPYEKKDLAMKRTFSGPPSGKGAIYEWDGDSNVGKGRIEIADVAPPRNVSIKLTMLKPFEAHNDVVFTLQPAGNTTNVTWAMNGHVPFFAKVVHLFFNMDKMVGGDFEAGLANLKAIAEK